MTFFSKVILAVAIPKLEGLFGKEELQNVRFNLLQQRWELVIDFTIRNRCIDHGKAKEDQGMPNWDMQVLYILYHHF